MLGFKISSVLFVCCCTLIFFHSIHPSFGQTALSGALQKELDGYMSSADTYRQAGNKSQEAHFYNKIAFLYWENEIHDDAIAYFKRSLSLNRELGNNNGVLSIHTNIGMIHSDKGEYQKALEHFGNSLDVGKRMNNKKAVANALNNMGVALGELKRYDEAIVKMEEALAKAKELNDLKLTRSCFGMLADIYEKKGDPQKSMEYFSLYTTFEKKLQKDELKRKEKENQAKISEMRERTYQAEAQMTAMDKELQTTSEQLKETAETLEKSELLNQQKQLELNLKELTLKEQEAKLHNEKLIRYSTIGGLILVGILAFVLFRGYSQKKKANEQLALQKQEIEDKNKKITDSIHYAKHIQEAILSSEEYLTRLFPDHFVLYLPKDILSGDFYWAYAPKNQKKVIWTAADCTGHGVPGALMSMIGNALLNEIIVENGVMKVNEILSQLRDGIMKVFSLQTHTEERQDGMDMALCIWDQEKSTISFAGANNPLYLVRSKANGHPELQETAGSLDEELYRIHENGQYGILELKPDKQPVGSYMGNEKPFSQTTIPVLAEDRIYLFSDGYIDQFGGPNNKKFTARNFRNLIFEIQHEPMEGQKQALKNAIDQWKGEGSLQMDDMLVMCTTIG